MRALTGKTIKAGVIGWPVAHSLSPRLHGYWLTEHAIDGVYVPLPVSPDDIEAAIRALPKLGFAGANVTVPHKEVVYRSVDELSDAAKSIGAVNTIICRDDGALIGDNTDAYGFITNIYAAAPKWQADVSPSMVLGAGGACRAVIAALLAAGAKNIRLANRTRSKAENIASHFGSSVNIVDWDERNAASEGCGLLVNTTTLGMSGKPELEISLEKLSDDAVVNDIVYTPLLTPLLAAANQRGLTPIDGLGMLLHQAKPGFEAWFGSPPEVTDGLREHVLKGLSES